MVKIKALIEELQNILHDHEVRLALRAANGVPNTIKAAREGGYNYICPPDDLEILIEKGNDNGEDFQDVDINGIDDRDWLSVYLPLKEDEEEEEAEADDS